MERIGFVEGNMNRFFKMPIWFLAVLVLSGAVHGKQPSVDGDRLDFELPDLSGTLVRSADERFQGKVVFVDLWGTFCPPCLTEIPTFIDLQERHRDAGLVVVGIAFERTEDPEERRARLRDFVEERGINYLILDGGSLAEFEAALPAMRNVSGFPVEVLIDRRGAVVEARNGYGYKKRWARKLEEKLVDLLEAWSTAD
jgi:thiol-disulfide isomerase/thioredoxin